MRSAGDNRDQTMSHMIDCWSPTSHHIKKLTSGIKRLSLSGSDKQSQGLNYKICCLIWLHYWVRRIIIFKTDWGENNSVVLGTRNNIRIVCILSEKQASINEQFKPQITNPKLVFNCCVKLHKSSHRRFYIAVSSEASRQAVYVYGQNNIYKCKLMCPGFSCSCLVCAVVSGTKRQTFHCTFPSSSCWPWVCWPWSSICTPWWPSISSGSSTTRARMKTSPTWSATTWWRCVSDMYSFIKHNGLLLHSARANAKSWKGFLRLLWRQEMTMFFIMLIFLAHWKIIFMNYR